MDMARPTLPVARRPPGRVAGPIFALAQRRNDAAAPRTGRRAGPRRSRLRLPRAHEAVGLAAPRPQRGRPRGHVPGPLRAQRLRRSADQAPRRPRSRRRRPGVRAHRPLRREPRRRRDVPHRTARRRRRAQRARSSSTGGRPSPSRSTGRPAASRWACCADATSSSRVARVLGLEDELFGGGHLGVGHDDGLVPDGDDADARPALRGYSTLLAALERGRTGTLGDIVATIQAEQDEIIRSPQAGVLVVQGGPGTGKTVVALHRAAYLLYTHRFPLEDQGVLVIGPNRVFLRYIERVLPSLGEAGVEQVVLADLVPDVEWSRPRRPGRLRAGCSRQGRRRACPTSSTRRCVDRERPLRDDLVVPFRTGYVRLTASESARIVKAARRRYRRHNGASALRRRRGVRVDGGQSGAARPCRPASCARRSATCPRCARLWSGCGQCSRPAQLLHDLFGSPALLRLAADRHPRRRARSSRCTALEPTTSATCAGRPPTSPCSTTPGRRSGPSQVAAARSPSPTRSARTGTSSSTRSRISRRCS